MNRPSARETFLVLGDGGWGCALAMVLESRGHDVRVWGYDADYSREMARTRQNTRFLPGVRLPETLRFGSNLAELADGAGIILCAIPTQFLRATLDKLKTGLPPDATLVTCSKGFERETCRRPSEIIAEVLGHQDGGNGIVILSGPSHAEEVSRGLPTIVVLASRDADAARRVQALVGTSRFRTYTSADPIGVEVGGAAKNVIAIACGISDGLGFGDNSRAGLITRGLREMTRLGQRLGALPETFSGLSGIGDLVATCTSRHSRNWTVGNRVGRGETLDQILSTTKKVAEGVETTRSMHQLARQLDADLPITHQVHAVLFDNKPPRRAVEDLMARELRGEMEE